MDNITKTRTILLSSDFKRYRSDTPTNFTCHFDRAVDVSEVERIVLKSVRILNLFPNVDDEQSLFYFSVSGVQYTADIPIGNYSATDFLAALQAAITATGATTCTSATVDPNTFQVVLATTDPIVVLSNVSVFDTYEKTDSMNQIIGAPYHDDTLPNTLTILPGVINLTGVTHVHIESGTLASSHTSNSLGDNRNVLCVVPIDVTYGVVQHWYSAGHLMSFVDFAGDRIVSTIDIKLTSHSGKVLQLPTNAEVSLEVMLVYRS